MNKEIFLKTEFQKQTILKYCEEVLESGKEHRVIFSPADKDKTLRQLGGLFGVWKKSLSDQSGYEVAWLHKYFKRKFF